MTFDTKMKSAYVICAILGTLGTLVLAQNDAVQTTPILVPKPSIPSSSAESSTNIADSGFNSGVHPTTAVPPNTTQESTTLSTVITTTTNATTTITTTTTTNSTTATPNNTTITSTITTIPTTIPTTPTPTSTPAPTSPKPTPTSPAPEPTATPTDAAKTTPVPTPSSKDRQFDGLSFFGGIVLTTCLMAIAAFSWRFYRQCKEGNYRTL